MDVAADHADPYVGEVGYYGPVYQCPNCNAMFAEPEVADSHIVNYAGAEACAGEEAVTLEASDIQGD